METRGTWKTTATLPSSSYEPCTVLHTRARELFRDDLTAKNPVTAARPLKSLPGTVNFDYPWQLAKFSSAAKRSVSISLSTFTICPPLRRILIRVATRSAGAGETLTGGPSAYTRRFLRRHQVRVDFFYFRSNPYARLAPPLPPSIALFFNEEYVR